MDYGVMLGGLGGLGGLQQALKGFGNTMATVAHNQSSKLTSLNRIAAETNRYIKDPNQRVTSNEPPIQRPKIFNSYEYRKYQYAKLSSDQNIRRLRLLPGNRTVSDPIGDEFISCKLEEVPLTADLKYEALSYTWGTLERDFPVLIVTEGEKHTHVPALFISPPLYAVLKRIRHPTEERVIWIDQLCINQDDEDERNKQVLLMADIYEKAQRTVVWLGEEDKDKNLLSEIVDLFGSHTLNTREKDIELAKPLIYLKGARPLDTEAHKQGHLRHQALVRLLNRSWFGRVWIFQEAVKSSHVILLCGSLVIPLEILLRLTHAVFELEEEDKGYAFSLTKSTTGFDTLYLIEHTRPNGCGDPDCERKDFSPGFLGILLQALQQLEATVPHDLIYAFLAFRAGVVISPNYKEPVSIAWTEAASSIIKSTHSLDILSAAHGISPCTQPIPSWVPDFKNPYPYARPICAPDFRSSFLASNALLPTGSATISQSTYPHEWQESSDPTELLVQGQIIGAISWLSPPNFEGSYYREGLKHFFEVDQHMQYLTAELNLYPKSKTQYLWQNMKDCLLRTMLADGAFGHAQPISQPLSEIWSMCEQENEIEKAARGVEGLKSAGEELLAQKELLGRVRQWSLIVQQKKVFLCQGVGGGGLELGLAPKSVVGGDLVVLMRGSKVPIVLRAATKEAAEEEFVGVEGGNGGVGDGKRNLGDGRKRYRVVGQCYLHGWMYGKVPKGRESMPGNKNEEFVLV